MQFVDALVVCRNRGGRRPAVIRELIDALASPGYIAILSRSGSGINWSRGCGCSIVVIQEIVGGIGGVSSVVLLLGDFFVKSVASLASGATKGFGVQLSLRKADMEGVVNWVSG